jgi:4-hydroxybenzoate polyprenyltransferase
MIPFYIAIIVACVAFWKFAAKLLIAVALFLLVSGIVMVINDLHHIAH